jgi:hypothetical protein
MSYLTCGRRQPRFAGLVLRLMTLAWLSSLGIKAQPPASAVQDPPAQQDAVQPPGGGTQKAEEKKADKSGSWIVAPIPINSPAIGAGMEWAVARLFHLDKKDEVSPASAVGAGGVFTNNGSRGVVFGGRLYLKQDKYRVTTAFGRADINLNIYGIGKNAGDQGVFIPLKTKGGGFFGEFLYQLKKNVYVGVRGQYRSLSLSLNQEELDSEDIITEPPEEVAGVIDQIRDQFLDQRTVSLGPRFQWDTRTDVFYPKNGILMDVAMDAFSTGLGSKFSYQYYKVAFNKYLKLNDYQVLAFRGMGCAAAGDRVPIYDLCLFGTANDLRGYPGGRYQDRRMFATQAEYRLMFPAQNFLGRFGIVAFGGVGGVARTFSDLAFEDLLPAGGGGLRFRMIKKFPVNFRIDYGVGKVGTTLTIGVMEAF